MQLITEYSRYITEIKTSINTVCMYCMYEKNTKYRYLVHILYMYVCMYVCGINILDVCMYKHMYIHMVVDTQ